MWCLQPFIQIIFRAILIGAIGFLSAKGLARETRTLDGKWLFQTNGAPVARWKVVTVPSNWEIHEGDAFNGVGWYRKELGRIKIPDGQRLFVQVRAAATATEVFWNGARIGSHLGGWTPFEFDVTDLVRLAQTNELRLRVDERVGHNTQGFLPIIEPHFGGLWQSVALEFRRTVHIDNLKLLARGNPTTQEIEVELPIVGAALDAVGAVELKWRERGTTQWQTESFRGPWQAEQTNGNVLRVRLPVRNATLWSPESPALYEVQAALAGGDVVRTRAAFREVTTSGKTLLLNGNPLNVRGVLNWGYYPPVLAPVPTEEQMRRDLKFVKESGFNLMKFCLWIPPQRFLELADEMGVLTWMEYPTWHPRFTAEHLEALRTEFREFFYYDRNHPSVIVRSLTCETGPSAELSVIQSLYDEAKRLIPGALVEDDSSWISWNRVSDFYDDHPYGNNDTWPSTLSGLNEYVGKHGEKPLLLGEAIAADTWPDWERLQRTVGERRPYWVPKAIDDRERWNRGIISTDAADALQTLRKDSLRYGMLMRKYQAETFRRVVPEGGYVVSVIRDFATASMGLMDYAGQPKWNPGDWAWQRDTALLLQTPADQRSCFGGTNFTGTLWLSHFATGALVAGTVGLTLVSRDDAATVLWSGTGTVSAMNPGQLARINDFQIPMPPVREPTAVRLRARVSSGKAKFENEWTLWIIPSLEGINFPVTLDASLTPKVRQSLATLIAPAGERGTNDALFVASKFSSAVTTALDNGGRVLMLPDGERNSLPLRSHWFLRGAPVISERQLPSSIPRELLLELQTFDLSSRVIPEPPYATEVDPMLMLWDTHDRTNVVTQGLVFETQAGGGRLLVSALQHERSPAGMWLARELLGHLAHGPAPEHALQAPTWKRLKEQIDAEEFSLTDRDWDFRPDPAGSGASEGWQKGAGTNGWTRIRTGKHWESEGHAALDGWAWYRLNIKVPPEWRGRPVFLTFTGVDDMYELYANGEFVARRGDIETRQTTFDETFSHDLTGAAGKNADLSICVRVYDWYGAGGIFRPVYLGTAAHRAGGDILSRGR